MSNRRVMKAYALLEKLETREIKAFLEEREREVQESRY